MTAKLKPFNSDENTSVIEVMFLDCSCWEDTKIMTFNGYDNTEHI
jgi:hypothetical protein